MSQDTKAYFQRVQRWEDDIDDLRSKSEKRAWLIAGTSTTVAVIALISLSVLAPLRRAVPYVFQVEKASGHVEFIQAADDRSVKGYSELLDKYWVQRYVLARESYYFPLLQFDYDTTLALSENSVGRQYAELFEGSNAKDKVLGAANEERVDILSIALSPDNMSKKAVVRFARTTRNLSNSQAVVRRVFIATLAYDYEPTALGEEKELIRNPLGFRVKAYRIDPEIADEQKASASTEVMP